MRKRTAIILLAIIIFGYVFGYSFYYYNVKLKQKPYVKEDLLSGDVVGFVDKYFFKNPDIEGRNFIGSSNASTTFVVFMDLSKDGSKFFITEVFARLKEEFIDTGMIRFYHKYYVTLQDFEAKSENYRISALLACMDTDDYYGYYFDIFTVKDYNGAFLEALKYKSEEELNQCVNNPSKELINDIIEVEKLSLSGLNPKFYIGIEGNDNIEVEGTPSYDSLKRSIRRVQILIGN
ncbi:thioredoxin domain-containing protein [Candidatus Woesearchaeota archaeon]|nr:thioredoxin domain-containing protein [Candidatus Woesearchaeota archaeon]